MAMGTDDVSMTAQKRSTGPLDAVRDYFFFFDEACVRADAATDFAALPEFGLLRIFEALLATLFEVFSFFAI